MRSLSGCLAFIAVEAEGCNLDLVLVSSFYTLFTLEKRFGAVKNFRALPEQLCQ